MSGITCDSGPRLFSLCTTLSSKVTGRHSGIEFHSYDDEHPFVCLSYKKQQWPLRNCILVFRMFKNVCHQLCLEFTIFWSHAHLKKLGSYLSVRVVGKPMHPSVAVQNLGVWFDANFSFADHVCNTSICKTCVIQKRDLRWVKRYLTDEAAKLSANAMVSSHLNYYNSLFRSLSNFNMRKLQCIQNTLSRIVTNCNFFLTGISCSQTPLLVASCHCIFKTATLVYKWSSFFIVVIQDILAK